MFRIWSSGRSIKLDARGGKTSADALSFNFVKIAGSIATKKQTSFGALLENYRFLENFQVRHLFLFLLPSSRSPRKWWKNMGICTDSGLTWMDSCIFVVTLFSLFTWFHVFCWHWNIGRIFRINESLVQYRAATSSGKFRMNESNGKHTMNLNLENFSLIPSLKHSYIHRNGGRAMTTQTRACWEWVPVESGRDRHSPKSARVRGIL